MSWPNTRGDSQVHPCQNRQVDGGPETAASYTATKINEHATAATRWLSGIQRRARRQARKARQALPV